MIRLSVKLIRALSTLIASLCILLLSLSSVSAADIRQDLTVSLSITCDLFTCSTLNDGIPGMAASGATDFSSIAPGWSFNFTTASPVSWDLITNPGFAYGAIFGYGGSFTMTGPYGLTLSGVVTSGSESANPGSEQVNVNFFGNWSNGLDGVGSASIFYQASGPGPGNTATLDTRVTPEPGTVILLGTGFVGLGGVLRRKVGF